jgi:hypothetical protein
MPYLQKLKNIITLIAETYYLFGIQNVFSLIYYTVSFKEMIDVVLRLLDSANLVDTMKVLTSGLFKNPASSWCEYSFRGPLAQNPRPLHPRTTTNRLGITGVILTL